MNKFRVKRLLRKANKRGIYIYGCDRKFKVISFYKEREGFCLLITNPLKKMSPAERLLLLSEYKLSWSFKPF